MAKKSLSLFLTWKHLNGNSISGLRKIFLYPIPSQLNGLALYHENSQQVIFQGLPLAMNVTEFLILPPVFL